MLFLAVAAALVVMMPYVRMALNAFTQGVAFGINSAVVDNNPSVGGGSGGTGTGGTGGTGTGGTGGTGGGSGGDGGCEEAFVSVEDCGREQ